MNWKSFAKALIPVAVGIVLAAADMVASGHFDIVRERALAAGLLTAIGVYLTPNATTSPPTAAAITALAIPAPAAAITAPAAGCPGHLHSHIPSLHPSAASVAFGRPDRQHLVGEHLDRYRQRHTGDDCLEDLGLIEFVLDWLAALDNRIARLEQAHTGPASFTVTIPNTAKDPTTMADKLPVTDTTKHAVVNFYDAHGNPCPPPLGALVSFTSSDASVAVDGPTGALTPVTIGVALITAAPTLADGSLILKADGVTPITGTPDEVDVTAGPIDTFTVAVA